MKLVKSIILLILIFAVLPLSAQETVEETEDPGILRSLGDQTFSFNAGLFVPLFSQDMDGSITSFKDHLSLGAVGSLEWNGYINKNMRIGGQLSGMFAFTPNRRTFSMVPITAKYSYIIDLYPITIPLSVAAGISFNKLDDLFQVTPIIKPGATFFWHFNPEWALGLNLIYWWTPEIHFDGDLQDQSRFGNFLEVSLSMLYHF